MKHQIAPLHILFLECPVFLAGASKTKRKMNDFNPFLINSYIHTQNVYQ
ncbi:hypothetical protein BLGI_3676 [Brevibacillus laterosporus GI-9]|nr:hypothetical protein BLGI_3676 [Brevibacillus laterosporus GI-9]